MMVNGSNVVLVRILFNLLCILVIFYDENYIINKDEIEVSLDDNLADNICDLLDKTTDNLSKIGWEFKNAIIFTLNNIKVLARISENKNINMYYLDDHSYKARINSADDDKSGEVVKVTIDKKMGISNLK